MFEYIQYLGGWLCIIAGMYTLIGSFVQKYIKGIYYSNIDILYNFSCIFAIAWGLTIIHYCK
jgi:hypothetical protein